MVKPKVIAWDQGGVIFRSHMRKKTGGFSGYFKETYGISDSKYGRAYAAKKFSFNHSLDLIQSEKSFLKELNLDLNAEDTLRMQYDILGTDGIYPEIISLLWEIDQAGIPNTYFTNGSVYYLTLLQYFGAIPKFIPGVASETVGVVKPDEQIYSLLENAVSKYVDNVSELLFIDDRDRNLQVAKERGWQVYPFIDNNRLIFDIQKLLK